MHGAPFDAWRKIAPHDQYIPSACRVKDIGSLRAHGRKPALLHHAVRLGVLEEVVGVYGARSEGVPSMVDEPLERLCGETLAPVGDADPVADRVLVIRLKIVAGIARQKTDRADKPAVLPQRYGVLLGTPKNAAKNVEALLLAFVRGPAGGDAHTRVSCELKERWGVCVCPGAQDKAGGEKFHGVAFHVRGRSLLVTVRSPQGEHLRATIENMRGMRGDPAGILHVSSSG